jgi:uncharacterized membrane protein YcaP (DUF421 family)
MDPQMWSNMFTLAIPVLEKIVRPLIVYLFLVIGLRLAGKRELAQLNTFDLVVLLTLSNTVQNAIIGNDTSVSGGLIGAATLLTINYFVVRFLYDHQKLDQIVEGKPDALIEHGKIRKDQLEKEVITLEELQTAAHKQGFGSLDNIDEAILEPGGTISFIAKQPEPEEQRQQELINRLEKISQELAELRRMQQGQLKP